MSLNYSFTGDWNGETKESVGKWVKEKLKVIQDGEAPEDLFLEYIIVMIGNGKRMQELSHELQDFIGEESANDFAADLGAYLQSIPPPEVKVQVVPLVVPPAAEVKVVKTAKDVLDGGLTSSRSSGPAQQKSRLLDTALRSTTSSHKRDPSQRDSSRASSEHFPHRQEVRPDVRQDVTTGFKTAGFNSNGQPPQPSTSAPAAAGLFTKRGIERSAAANNNQSNNSGDLNKRRKIIVEGSHAQSAAARNIAGHNAVVRGMVTSDARGFGPGPNGPNGPNFPPGPPCPPVPVGFPGQMVTGPGPMDPSMMYMEQMNIMARMSGFGSVEEMMFFQQSMMANMMGGGMPMAAPFGAPMPLPQQMHAYPPGQQFGRGGGRFPGGRGDGRGGRGRGRGDVPNSGATQSPPPPPPKPAMPVKITAPIPTQPRPVASQSSEVKVAAVTAVVPPAVAAEEDHGCVFGYSGGGGPGGFRGRGRGRGRGFSRGGHVGEDGAGRGIPEHDEGSGGRFGYAGRGRGAFRGRGGYHVGGTPGATWVAQAAEGAPVAPAVPPVSLNKVWVREVDMESSLVAGR